MTVFVVSDGTSYYSGDIVTVCNLTPVFCRHSNVKKKLHNWCSCEFSSLVEQAFAINHR